MKAVIFSVLFSVLSVTAFAQNANEGELVKVSLTLVSDRVEGVQEYRLRTLSDGKIEITINPNTCTGEGINTACTTKGLITQVVTPIFVQDNRPADGALVLQLNEKLQLAYSIGLRGGERYALHERLSQGGPTKNIKLHVELGYSPYNEPSAR
ncbi:MAG: hypothetical protein ABL958_05515 [Bdellovibrionia bacterium]